MMSKEAIFKPPQLRLTERRERHATWLELFFDLVFVVAITQLSERLAHHLNFIGILQIVALFIPVWWCWAGHTVYSTRFDTDDGIHRLATFVMMFAAAIMTVKIPTALEEGTSGFAMGYIVARVALIFLYARVLYFIPTVKRMAVLYLIGFSLGLVCWIISIFVPAPTKFWLWALGISIDFMTPWIGKRKILVKLPLDTSHIPERFGLFTIIVLGETVAGVILGLTHTQWHFLTVTAGFAAFILAILIWWQYYSNMQITDYRCSLQSGQPFIYSHLPLAISLVIIGVAVEYTIITALSPLLSSNLNGLFCLGAVLWFVSFSLIQFVSTPKYTLKMTNLFYLGAIIATLFLFFGLSWSPLLKIVSLDIIFLVLLMVDYNYRIKLA